jgi:hypothetical protein
MGRHDHQLKVVPIVFGDERELAGCCSAIGRQHIEISDGTNRRPERLCIEIYKLGPFVPSPSKFAELLSEPIAEVLQLTGNCLEHGAQRWISQHETPLVQQSQQLQLITPPRKCEAHGMSDAYPTTGIRNHELSIGLGTLGKPVSKALPQLRQQFEVQIAGRRFRKTPQTLDVRILLGIGNISYSETRNDEMGHVHRW